MPRPYLFKIKGETLSPRLDVCHDARLTQFLDMLVQLALRNALRLILDDLFHFFRRKAQFEIRVCFFRRAAIAEFLFTVLHRKEIKVMWIVETTHYRFLIHELKRRTTKIFFVFIRALRGLCFN